MEHILQNKSVGIGRYLFQKYCQIPTSRITDVASESSALPPMPVIPPAGFTVTRPLRRRPKPCGSLVGRGSDSGRSSTDESWQRGTRGTALPRGAFSQSAAYTRKTFLRLPLATPRPRPSRWGHSPGLSGPCDPAPPDPDFEFGRWLVTARGLGPGWNLGPAGPGNGNSVTHTSFIVSEEK